MLVIIGTRSAGGTKDDSVSEVISELIISDIVGDVSEKEVRFIGSTVFLKECIDGQSEAVEIRVFDLLGDLDFKSNPNPCVISILATKKENPISFGISPEEEYVITVLARD